ncbi:hypothetical protein GCM10023155_46720 [Bremerella cremea]
MRSAHILHGILSSDWSSNIDAHIGELADVLEIEGECLDHSLPSLNLVEQRIVNNWSGRSFYDQRKYLFSPLLAYTGEIVRRALDGEWLIENDSETNTLVPWVVDKFSRRYYLLGILDPFDPSGPNIQYLGLGAMVRLIPKCPVEDC